MGYVGGVYVVGEQASSTNNEGVPLNNASAPAMEHQQYNPQQQQYNQQVQQEEIPASTQQFMGFNPQQQAFSSYVHPPQNVFNPHQNGLPQMDEQTDGINNFSEQPNEKGEEQPSPLYNVIIQNNEFINGPTKKPTQGWVWCVLFLFCLVVSGGLVCCCVSSNITGSVAEKHGKKVTWEDEAVCDVTDNKTYNSNHQPYKHSPTATESCKGSCSCTQRVCDFVKGKEFGPLVLACCLISNGLYWDLFCEDTGRFQKVYENGRWITKKERRINEELCKNPSKVCQPHGNDCYVLCPVFTDAFQPPCPCRCLFVDYFWAIVTGTCCKKSQHRE